MCCIGRGIFRWALIGGLALGGATLLIGPERVMAGFAQVRAKVQACVDDYVEDPVALRQQLQALSEQYPEKIAEVRVELNEVERQIAQLERDSDVAKRVVAKTSSDLGELQDLLARADAEAATGQAVAIRFNAVRFDVPAAKQEFRRIHDIRVGYQDRVALNERDLHYLNQQKARLIEILSTLESEFASFEAQMWQLDRKIDAIARNERLIDMIEERQATLDDLGRYEVSTLTQLRNKLEEWELKTTTELESLERKLGTFDYEKEARFEIESENASDWWNDNFNEKTPKDDSHVKELRSGDNTFAYNDEKIVE